MTQYVACTFKPGDTRTYTYANDGDAVFPGDRVKVPDNRSDGWKAVTVVSVTDEAPSFPCKPILGRVEDAPLEELPVYQPDPNALDGDVVQF